MNQTNQEIEVRFLEIDKELLCSKLAELKAKDFGEELLEEIIFYHPQMDGDRKFVRLRKNKNDIFLTYKHHHSEAANGTEEIELKVDDMNKAKELLERIGWLAQRHQQKQRHTFMLDDVTVDIDTWPRIPTYVELEGPSEQSLKDVAKKLDLDWNNVCLKDAKKVIQEIYHIPVGKMTWFTFDKFE